MSVCIYCKEDKELSEFNTEHVLHRAFGGFQSNLTLAPAERPAVCRVCNQHLGDTIDREITRDSYEAFQRLFQGHRDPNRPEELLAMRVRVTLPDDSPHGPLLLELGPPMEGRPGLYLVPQVRFRQQDGSWVCVAEDDLTKRNPACDSTLRPDEVAVFCGSAAEEERLKSALRDIGLEPTEWIPAAGLPPQGVRETELDVTGHIDSAVARAVAKISFNYLCWGQGAELVLRPDFDAVRSFIRYGHGDWPDFVQPSWRPILRQDTEVVRHTGGHLITVGFANGTGGTIDGRIIGQVSLYNTMTYRVKLCERFHGIWREIASGHHYNLVDRRVDLLLRAHHIHVPVITPVIWTDGRAP